ncbi:unnamed protein product [Periconia digitata]|uniref:Secreted protein n=1 Tax=Periconia digitata TaxID=1303443 RepID=A0A9W4UQW2_9PLEO|nr:unnamed protein product [Periconia digitata]
MALGFIPCLLEMAAVCSVQLRYSGTQSFVLGKLSLVCLLQDLVASGQFDGCGYPVFVCLLRLRYGSVPARSGGHEIYLEVLTSTALPPQGIVRIEQLILGIP